MHKIRRSLTGNREELTSAVNTSIDSECIHLESSVHDPTDSKDDTRICKWGILGCANIARKNCRSIQMSPNSRICALASRQIAKAEAFRDQNRLPIDIKIYEGYDALLDDPDIDAVYIPLPTTLHLEWVVKAANAHKHILIEKPVAIDADQFYIMIMTCKNNNVLLMDGVMFMHHDRMSTLDMFLKDPRCGQVARVDSVFSFNGGSSFLEGGNIRTRASGDPLGALGDLGWYSVRLGQIAFARGLGSRAPLLHPENSLARPSHCIATCDSWTTDGVPLDCDAKVYFHLPPSPASASSSSQSPVRKYGVLVFHSSFLLPLRQSYNISIASDIEDVKDQNISCNDFVLPHSPYSSSIHIEIGADLIDNHHRLVSLQNEVKTGPCVQEANMITTFATIATSGTLQQKLMWSKIACQTQLIVSACFASMQRGGARVDIPALQDEYFE